MVHTYLRTYLHFNVCYPSEPGLAGLISVFFLHLFQKDALGISGRDCYRLNALPVVQPTVSKQRRKLKALTKTSGLASSFLHPPLDSWWKVHHFLHIRSPTPVPVSVHRCSSEKQSLFWSNGPVLGGCPSWTVHLIEPLSHWLFHTKAAVPFTSFTQ